MGVINMMAAVDRVGVVELAIPQPTENIIVDTDGIGRRNHGIVDPFNDEN
ncbi:hypothetical protein CULC0102_1016 [Corynebacterium ulcerans 0102]|nr:hypothetical protein CULC0102_1016 [Corynebacterium ulcerans 0102]